MISLSTSTAQIASTPIKCVSPTAERVPLVTALRDCFDKIPDPRVNRTKLHRLSDILILALAAVCCGAEGFEDFEEWAKLQGVEELRRDFGLPLENGIPHHDTFRRLLARLRPEPLEESLHMVRKHLPGGCDTPKHVAVDGKALCGSHDALKDCPAIMLLSAFSTDHNMVLGQRKIDVKSNEIPAAVEVLHQIDIAGATITALVPLSPRWCHYHRRCSALPARHCQSHP